MTIQTRAMLAQLSISQWTARKQDKTVTAEVEKSHAAHDAGKFNKLLVNRGLLEPISKIAGKVREYHYKMTLPWNANGAWLLPSAVFMEYTAQIRAFKAEFERAVRDMLVQYPNEVQAARNRLGTMYDPGDYPEPWALQDKFSIDVEFSPMPDAKDFRVDVSNEALDELRSSVTSAVADRQAQAVKACYARIQDVVSKIYERLSVPDAIFKDSLITNAIELCAVLDGLNITDDPGITSVCAEIRKNLLLPPSMLRSRPDIRAAAALAAQNILQKLHG